MPEGVRLAMPGRMSNSVPPRLGPAGLPLAGRGDTTKAQMH